VAALGGDLGRLVVRIETDISKLRKGLDDGTKDINGFSSTAGKAILGVTAAFAAMSVAAAGAIAKITTESVKYGIELDRMARRANTTASEIARLSYALQQEHGDIEALNRSLPILARNMAAAASGGKQQADAFRDLGVNVRNADGSLKSTTQVFYEIADGVENSKNQTKALADVMQVLGRGAGDLYPLLQKGGAGIRALGAEFDKFGLSGDKLNKFATDAEALGDVWDKIKTQFQLAGLAMSSELLPALLQVSEKIASYDWVAIGAFLGGIITQISTLAGWLLKIVEIAGKIPPWMQQAGMTGLGAMAASQAGTALQSGVVGMGAGAGATIGGAVGTGGGAPGAAPAGAAPAAGGAPASGGAGGGGQNTLGGVIQGLQFFTQKLTETLTGAKSQIGSFQESFIEMGVQITDIFTTSIGAMFDTFGNAFGEMIVQGKDFSDSLSAGFQSLATQFVSAVASMILKWTAFIAAVMAIALILAAFGVPIGTTFTAAFKLIGGGDGGDALGTLKKAGGKFLGGFLGFREGGAVMARNGIYSAGAGMAYTGALGEGGIPTMIHPNEVVAPVDKLFDFMKSVSGGGGKGVAITINGYNRDPRELARFIAEETDRKRRNPF